MGATILAALLQAPAAFAHLMPPQRGTLNIVGGSAYLVLSLPVSAFAGVDDDGDGLLSVQEFATHRSDMLSAVRRHVQLRDARGALPVDGLMASPATPHDAPSAPFSQVIVLGRFDVSGSTGGHCLQVRLFGTGERERSLVIGVTANGDDRRQPFTLTPDDSIAAIDGRSDETGVDTPSSGAVATQSPRSGATPRCAPSG